MARKRYVFRDFKCADEHVTRTFVEDGVPLVPCQTCGADAILPQLFEQAVAIVGDEIDYVDHNLGREPIRIRSKAERRRLMKERGLVEFIRHVPVPGTDQSPYTTDWSKRIDPYTAEQARILVERVHGGSKPVVIEESIAPVEGAFSYEATPAQVREVAEILGIEVQQ